MSDFILKVSDNALIQQANMITTNLENIRSALSQIRTTVYASKQYWQGAASSLHIKNYNITEPRMEEIINRLKEHPKDLLQMANLYQETERQNADAASALPSQIIS